VANIGQPMPKSDSKVFEVNIRVFGSDPDLKPAMTTGNVIQTGAYNDKIYIPSEAVFETDSTKYVYVKKKDVVRQLVDLGDENEDYVIVNKGVQEDEVLLLNEPEKPEEILTVGWEIYEEQIQKLKESNELDNEPVIKEPATESRDSVKGERKGKRNRS